MPKVEQDPALLQAIEAVVRQAGHNESEAARRLGVTRLRINRIRKQGGGAVPATRHDLWQRIQRLSSDVEPIETELSDTQVIQIVRDVPQVALQVLRYMTDAVERDLEPEGHTDAS